ncbi:MAG: TSUP family transporter [Candidatus Saccharimonadales bacterium]
MTWVITAIILGIYTFINIVAPMSGSATVTPFLAGLVGAKDAIAVASFFFFLSCIPRIWLFREYIDWKLVKRLWPISIIGAIIGSSALVGLNEKVVLIIILGFLLWFIAQKTNDIISNSSKRSPSKLGTVATGLMSGILQGTGLAGSDLRNGYLLSRGIDIPTLHGTTALIGGANFLFATIVRLASGDATVPMLLPILGLLPIIVFATYIGKKASLRLSKRAQAITSLTVMAIAAVLIIRSLMG